MSECLGILYLLSIFYLRTACLGPFILGLEHLSRSLRTNRRQLFAQPKQGLETPFKGVLKAPSGLNKEAGGQRQLGPLVDRIAAWWLLRRHEVALAQHLPPAPGPKTLRSFKICNYILP